MSRLTDSELEDLTGYKSPRKQAEWVREELRLDPAIGADDRPRLTWSVVDQAMLARRIVTQVEGSPIAPATGSVSSDPQPNWKKAA